MENNGPLQANINYAEIHGKGKRGSHQSLKEKFQFGCRKTQSFVAHFPDGCFEKRGVGVAGTTSFGSAKLEKAEILQMTVDHLKMLQATGGKGFFDAHALAMDFMSIGFRECLTEVARYLSSVEGVDTSDPLRVRLVSHLSTCASQREATAMTTSMAHHHHSMHPQHWTAAFHHLPTALLQQTGLHSSENMPCRLSVASEGLPPHASALLTATFSHADSGLRGASSGSIAPCAPPLPSSLLSLSATVHAAAAAAAAQSFPLSLAGAFPALPPGAAAAMAASAISPPLSLSTNSSPRQTSNSKPYRPWGTEVGAF